MKNILLAIWQFPQTILGLALLLYYRPSITLKDEHGVTIVFSDRMSGGISLGQVVIVGTHNYTLYDDPLTQSKTVMHELGHCAQSRILGWLYLFSVGICSIVWAGFLHGWIYPDKYEWYTTYYCLWCERWADKLGGVER